MTLRQKIVSTELIIQSVALIAGLLLHHLAGERVVIAVAFALTIETFAHVIAFLAHYLAPIEKAADWVESARGDDPIELIRHMRDTSIVLTHVTAFPKDWPFREQYMEVVQKFRSDLDGLTEGHYEIQMDDILDVSMKAAESIEIDSFCTALEENLDIFVRGSRETALKNMQYHRARKLAADNQVEFGFTRLFIFDDPTSIEFQHLELMEENAANAIRVLVVARRDVEPLFRATRRGMDFGRWRSDLLMEIRGSGRERSLYVSKKGDDLVEVNGLIRALTANAEPLADFIQRVRSPVNLSQWSIPRTNELLDLVAPDGPHPEDVGMMLKLVSERASPGDTVAVYGLTRLLVEGAERIAKSGVKVEVIDARHYVSHKAKDGIIFLRGNWLDWRQQGKYAAVVADDVLCNLSQLQIPMFFNSLYESLRPEGTFVVRTTGQYSHTVVRPSAREIIAELRKFDLDDKAHEKGLDLQLLDPGSFYEAVWPVLHTDQFYDSKTRSFLFKNWNDAVQAEPGLTVALRNHLTFKRLLRMTSLRYEELERLWEKYFYEQQAMDVYSRWLKDPSLVRFPGATEIGQRFQDFYRILVLRRKPS